MFLFGIIGLMILKEVGDPNMWLKANPNLDKTVSYETYHLDVEGGESSINS